MLCRSTVRLADLQFARFFSALISATSSWAMNPESCEARYENLHIDMARQGYNGEAPTATLRAAGTASGSGAGLLDRPVSAFRRRCR